MITPIKATPSKLSRGMRDGIKQVEKGGNLEDEVVERNLLLERVFLSNVSCGVFILENG